MDALTTWLVIFAIGVPTFLVRYSFIGLLGWFDEVPDTVETALRFVPAAVLAALVAPEFVAPTGTLGDVPPGILAGGLAATAVAWRTENVFATIASGMVVLWIVRFGF